ncbi:MAG: exodeoxyribonuclease VII large subunit [Bdellovibrio sp.]|nr:MAG: exodeoxyribonuclease VII large subunit [Bdellovibrio sp.]
MSSEDIQLSLLDSSEDQQLLSVSDLNRQIRALIENQFPLVWVQGEISNFKAHSSGHYYFSLKDAKSQINAVMFKGFNRHLKFKPESGMEVIVRGKVTVYEPRGSYQILVETMEPKGAGALQLAFEQLKKKLQAEGLFDPDRKKPLPPFPQVIGVVTSPTGAAIRDILNVLKRRHSGVEVLVIPALVQGKEAKESIASAIELAQKIKTLDVLIVGRGGGSIEDLWAFNEEIVARAIANSQIPIISAVGHEVDYTIADFVADLRAPTPSAAAELVVKNKQDLQDKIQHLQQRLLKNMEYSLESLKKNLSNLQMRLVDPRKRIQDGQLRCDELSLRLEQSIFRLIENKKNQTQLLREKLPSPLKKIAQSQQQVQHLMTQQTHFMQSQISIKKEHLRSFMALLESLSPLHVVKRGYAIVKKEKTLIKSTEQLKKGDQVQVNLAKGAFKALVQEIIKN